MPLPSNASLQDVINSLNSTQGVNAKTELASVIGSPAAASDEVLLQSQKLQTGKTNLRDAIVAKGQTLTTNPTFDQMTTAIDSIEVAKKTFSVNVTSSSVQSPFINQSGNSQNFYAVSVDISSLDFSPSLIIFVSSTVAVVGTWFNYNYLNNASLIANMALGTNGIRLTTLQPTTIFPVSSSNANYKVTFYE